MAVLSANKERITVGQEQKYRYLQIEETFICIRSLLRKLILCIFGVVSLFQALIFLSVFYLIFKIL